MRVHWLIRVATLGAFALVTLEPVRAQQQASALYKETNLGGGLWQYDYTLYNNLDPIAFPDHNLFDFVFNFSPTATATAISLPFGWDFIPDAGSIEAFAVNVGAPPIGDEIAPGASLSGFVFQFNYRAGDLPITAFLINPNDPSTPLRVDGTSTAAPSATDIPEPGTLAFLSPALLPLLSLIRRRRRASHRAACSPSTCR